MRYRTAQSASAIVICIVFAACGSEEVGTSVVPTPTSEPHNFTVAFSERERIASPDVPDEDIEVLSAGNGEFALDLYDELVGRQDGNLFMSPHSISLALAMTYAGASGTTAEEMAEALEFNLSPEKLHAAFNSLDQLLAARGADLEPDQKFTLEIANSIWGQQGFEFEQEFLDTLAEHYGAGMRLVDYLAATEEARETINGWVEDNTNDRIKNLIPQGALTAETVLVLANAIFFKAAWAHEFDPDMTEDGVFTLVDGSTVDAEMMRQERHYQRSDGDGFSAIELLYVGGETSMVVIVPDEGKFHDFESTLDAQDLEQIVRDFRPINTDLRFPKFTFESKFSLPEPLKALGMRQAFDPIVSDFSGMREPPPTLFIMEVIHQSFVAVDEEGTEAAGATAVVVGATSLPPPPTPFVVDRPFIFLIRDVPTDSVLFIGRLLDPT